MLSHIYPRPLFPLIAAVTFSLLQKTEKNLDKREAELNRREAELRRLEQELQRGAGTLKNWPPYCAFTYHDIRAEIPQPLQGMVRSAYWAYLVRRVGGPGTSLAGLGRTEGYENEDGEGRAYSPKGRASPPLRLLVLWHAWRAQVRRNPGPALAL